MRLTFQNFIRDQNSAVKNPISANKSAKLRKFNESAQKYHLTLSTTLR